jgi:hypothetical protein
MLERRGQAQPHATKNKRMKSLARWKQLIDVLGLPTSTRSIDTLLPGGSRGTVTWEEWPCDCIAQQIATSHWEHRPCQNPDHVAISRPS